MDVDCVVVVDDDDDDMMQINKLIKLTNRIQQ